MITKFLDFFIVLMEKTFLSELFYFPVILCLCAYLVLLVIDMIRGRY